MNRSSQRTLTAVFLGIVVLLSGLPTNAQTDLSGSWDVIVIGGGLMGSSTAWQLSRRGQRVLLLEKQGEVYTQGSSFGEARISRSLGPPGDIWSYMHNRTVAEAGELIAFLNEQGHTASMSDIYTTSPVNYVRRADQSDRVAYLPDQADRYELVKTPKQAKEMFGLTMPDDAFIVREYKEHSGTINPAALIALLHRGTTLSGGRVAYGQEVTRLARASRGFEVDVVDTETGDSQTLTVGKVVSAAGPYTGDLLEEVAPDFSQLVTPKRVFLAFFEVEPRFWNALSASEQQRLKDLFPAINSTIPGRDASSFSMIERYTDRGTPIIKIGGHFQRTDVQDLDSVWAASLSDDEIAWAQKSVLRHLSLLGVGLTAENLDLVSGYSCVYSLTASEVPYVTQAAQADGSPDPNLIVVAGLSGVGAKGSMAYGVIATDLLMGRSESDAVYRAAREAFGFERLLEDVAAIDQ